MSEVATQFADMALLLWKAIDSGDGSAYAALIDYYLEAGNELAANGVRKAQPRGRRPWLDDTGAWCWCGGPGGAADLIRSTIRDDVAPWRLPEIDRLTTPTAAWEFLADYDLGP